METERLRYGKPGAELKPLSPINTRGQEAREAVYSEMYAQGFRFQTNVRSEDVGKYVSRHVRKGLEVFVGQRAFQSDGTGISYYKTILVRGK